MDSSQIIAVFNMVLTAFSPAISVLIGAVVAGSILIWVIKRLT